MNDGQDSVDLFILDLFDDTSSRIVSLRKRKEEEDKKRRMSIGGLTTHYHMVFYFTKEPESHKPPSRFHFCNLTDSFRVFFPCLILKVT